MKLSRSMVIGVSVFMLVATVLLSGCPNSLGAYPTSVNAFPTSVNAFPTSVNAFPTSVNLQLPEGSINMSRN